jgi:hypothetical protein
MAIRSHGQTETDAVRDIELPAVDRGAPDGGYLRRSGRRFSRRKAER